MRFTVVHVALAFQANRQLFFRLRDRQGSVYNRDVVVRSYIRLTRLDHYIGLRRDRARIGVRFNARGAERYVVRVSAHQAYAFRRRRHFNRVDRNRASGVFLRLALASERYRPRSDRQSAGYRRDGVVRRHVFFAVHDLVALSDRVGSRITYIRHTAGRYRHQGVPCRQAAAGYGYLSVLMRAAVIRPRIGRRFNRDNLLVDYQLARRRGNAVGICYIRFT